MSLRLVTTLSASTAVLLLAACGATPADPAPAAASPEPVLAQPAAPPAAVAGARFEFAFTALDGAEDDPRIVDWQEDPCGMSAIAAVDRLPVDDKALLPDYVIEFDAEGAAVRRWAKPFSAEILTIAGDRLQFRAPQDDGKRVFWTTPDGTFGLHDVGPVDPARTVSVFPDGASAVDCPVLPEFAGSDYVQCYEITDATGQRRRIAFEGACS